MTRLFSPLLLMLALILVSSCDSNGADVDDYVRLNEAQRLWRTSAIDTYIVEQSVLCFCGHPSMYSIRVEADSIVAISIIDPDLILWDIDDEELRDIVYSIDEVFALITEHIDTAHQIDVEYHPLYGYPTEVYLDRNENIIDEELTIRMGELEVFR